MIELLRSQSDTIKATRSTALQPLLWMAGSFLAGLVASVSLDANHGLSCFLGGITLLIALVAIGSYVYLLIVDRDALRSEHYNIAKMQIERGLTGDSISGLTDQAELPRRETLKLEEAEDGER